MNPEISIIIPTHNRYALLSRTLDALGRQTEHPQNYEVIVVADGCQDETVAAIKRLSTPYRLTLIEQPQSGPGAARNRGAEFASAPILLFLDDDIEPTPEFVRAHLNAHKRWPEDVILGYSPFSDKLDQNDFANISSKEHWSQFFEHIASQHRFKFWDLSSSNFSILRSLFEGVGGFDAELLDAAEDAEFGFKLLKQHAHFRFVQEAAGKHYAKRSEKFYFRRIMNEGRVHTIFVRKHPEIIPCLSLYYLINKSVMWEFYPPACPNRVLFPRQVTESLFKLLWLNPLFAKFLTLSFQLLLSLAKFCKNYNMFLYIQGRMGFFLYWRGVQMEMGSLAKTKQLVKDALNVSVKYNEIDIDVKTDFKRIDKILSQVPVDAVSLHYGNLPIGRIEPEIGAESLRSSHIHEALTNFIDQGFIYNLELINPTQGTWDVEELASQILLFLDKLSNDDEKKLFFCQGWYELEKWDGIDTRWMKDEACLIIVWDEIGFANLNLGVKSLYRPRTLEIYANNLLAGKWPVPKKFVDISIQIPLGKGLNVLKLNVPEGCEKPRDHVRLLNRDSRCLSIAVQNISLNGLSANQLIKTLKIPPVESVQFGDLRRLTPISRAFGFDRGLPIDRYYMERFLSSNMSDIQGHVLEIGDDFYTRKFGGNKVAKSDVLHFLRGNPLATIVADLSRADDIPSDTFDCIILTQTLQMIYDFRTALRHIYRILKPGGVLLLTTHGINRISDREKREGWGEYWRLTAQSALRLIHEFFPPANVRIKTYGNVLAAISFLEGLAAQELSKEELDYLDPDFELLISVRAVKP